MNSNKRCIMCGSNAIDNINLGEFKTLDEINAHYYCLLLSTTIQQNGQDNEGILGFLKKDILDEVNKSRNRFCHYCKQRGASISCSAKGCRINFHLACGLKHETGHEFFGAFLSTCHSHRPRQKYLIPTAPKTCPICYEPVIFKIWTNIIWAPCCRKNFFHKDCLQKLALNAGYFFKCPLCTDVQRFQKCVKKYGVFVPDCDASWETEPDAFQELYERHNECNVTCLCPKGNKYSGTGQWCISLCRTCGLQGGHYACIKARNMDRGTFACDICKSIKTVAGNNESNHNSNTNETPPSCSTDQNGSDPKHFNNDSDQTRSTNGAPSDDEDVVILIDSDDDEEQHMATKTPLNGAGSPVGSNFKHLVTQDGSFIPVRIISKDVIKTEVPITFVESGSEVESPPRKVARVTRSTSQNLELVESDNNDFGFKISDVRTLSDVDFEENVQLPVVQENIHSNSSTVYQNGVDRIVRNRSTSSDSMKSPTNHNGSLSYDTSGPKRFNYLSINSATNSGTDLSDSDSDVVIVD